MAKKKVLETVFTKYTEICLLGSGGTSQVYEVVDDDGNIFSAKLLTGSKSIGTEVKKRFKNEINFCKKTDHKNIIKVLDSGVYFENGDSCPFYIMPKYDSSLRTLINAGITKSNFEIYINQILNGIEAAHLLGVVHRDIKPENILFDSKYNILVIADFGIAAFSQEQLYTLVDTKDGKRLANFQYASPEQRMRGKTVDLRSDIYSLGLVFNEMITKELAIGTSYREIGQVIPELSFLDQIIRKMISNAPNDRYNSISEIKLDLIGKKREYTQLQIINREKSRVIPISEIDEALLKIPTSIVDIDWDNGTLVLYFDSPTNPKWINSLYNMGSYSFLMGKEPSNFTIHQNTASISASESEVQMIVNHFKQWLINTRLVYINKLKAEKDEEIRKIKEEQRNRIEQEEARMRVRNSTKL